MKNRNSISRMTLGTVQLGLNYGIANKEGKPDEEKAFRIIDSARASGVNCIDTAALYGESEKVIGKYLAANGKIRSELSIVTKIKLGNISPNDVEICMMGSLEKSLKNLDTDYLDILMIHDAKEFSIFGTQITKVLEKLLYHGIIKSAGASCYEFSEIEGMLDNDIFHAFQIPLNIFDMRITKGCGAERLSNKLVFARSIFLQGLFFMNPSELKGNLKEIARYLLELKKIAKEMNISVSQLAISYVNSLEFIDSLVIGADNPDQVIENSYMLDSNPLNQDVMNIIENRLQGVPHWLLMPSTWDKQI
jgi:aryl-alcohol dehydrogenase-like predicted oxidoreductase